MPGASTAEVYFIAAMMVLILILCTVSVYIFVRQYRKEMREKALRDSRKRDAADGKPTDAI